MKAILALLQVILLGTHFSSVTSMAMAQRCTDKRDAELITKLRHAVLKKLPPDKVEDYVGSKAVINTVREKDRNHLRRLRFENDPAEKKMPNFDETKYIVFWNRPSDSSRERIVGIAYFRDGTSEIFSALMPDP